MYMYHKNKNERRKKISVAILAGGFCLAVFSGCADAGKEAPEQKSAEESQQGAGSALESAADMDNPSEVSEETDGTAKSGSLGEFSIQDITGKTYTNEIFQDYELTMVNAFTTWCTPCVNEIPDLEKLNQELTGQGVQIVGIVLDAVADEKGTVDAETVEKAKLLAERTGASYPFLIPDADGLNGRLNGIQAVPETFFVDKNGTVVGETYTGSNSLEGWKQVVEAELASLRGEQP